VCFSVCPQCFSVCVRARARVCVWVCVYVCVCLCMYKAAYFMYVCPCVYLNACVCASVFVYMHVGVYMRVGFSCFRGQKIQFISRYWYLFSKMLRNLPWLHGCDLPGFVENSYTSGWVMFMQWKPFAFVIAWVWPRLNCINVGHRLSGCSWSSRKVLIFLKLSVLWKWQNTNWITVRCSLRITIFGKQHLTMTWYDGQWCANGSTDQSNLRMWHLLRIGHSIGQASWAFDRINMCAILVFNQSIKAGGLLSKQYGGGQDIDTGLSHMVG
jgi:hypothetical protein